MDPLAQILLGPPGAYAGIGSRETPIEVCRAMARIAISMAARGWCLRSGRCDRADQSFEFGAVRGRGVTEIFLPWPGFGGRGAGTVLLDHPSAAATFVAKNNHPNWQKVTRAGRLLLGRTSHVILGRHLDTPSKLVLCWTPDGATENTTEHTGGTGQGIRVARGRDIQIINLALQRHMDLVVDALLSTD